MIKKNNRGDISITVLVIGVFVVCMVAMASFLYANTKFSSGFAGLNIAEQVSSDVEQFYTYVNLGYTCSGAANLIDAEYGSNVLTVHYSVKEQRGFWSKKEIVFVDIIRTVYLSENFC